MGVLDGFTDFIKTPAGQGVLGAVFGAMAGRGNTMQALGQGGLLGLSSYSNAQERQQQMERDKASQDWIKTQRDWALQDRTRAEADRTTRENFMNTALTPQPILQPSRAPVDMQATNPYADPKFLFETAKANNLPGVDQVPMGIKPINPIDAVRAKFEPSEAAQLHALSLPPKPRTMTLKPGETVLNADTMEEVYSAPERETPTELARLTREMQSLPPGHPMRQVYADAIRKSTTHAPGTSVNVSNKYETEYSKDQGKQFSEMMAGINKQGFTAPAQIRKLERLEQLLQGVDGGKLAPAGLEIASALNAMGIKVDPRLGNKEASEALSREIAGGFRQPGSGPTTDKDFDNFLLQVPSLSKSAQGRKQITATMKAALNRDIQLAKMAREYERRHGVLDNGFLDEAAQFIAENPVVSAPTGWKVQR